MHLPLKSRGKMERRGGTAHSKMAQAMLVNGSSPLSGLRSRMSPRAGQNESLSSKTRLQVFAFSRV